MKSLLTVYDQMYGIWFWINMKYAKSIDYAQQIILQKVI